MSDGDVSTPTQILDAATRLIVRDGVRGLSMRNLAEEADVSLGLINYHFDDKDSLIVAAFEQVTNRELDASMAAIEPDDDPETQIRVYIGTALSGSSIEPDYLAWRISLWAVARTDERLAQVEDAYYRRYRAPLEAMVARADPSLSASEIEARITDVIGVENGAWLHAARFGDTAALSRAIDRCVAIAFGRDVPDDAPGFATRDRRAVLE